MADPNSNPNFNPNPNPSSKNPFLDPASLAPSPSPSPSPSPLKWEPDLLVIAKKGVVLVTAITKYLSTLPHPIEIVEELVAVCAVTSTLLTSLHATIERFPHLELSTTNSFVAPLCHDVLFAFRLLGSKVEEARRMRVFEPNDVGLVRLPRVAWSLVLGSDIKVAALRSRLYVEKYRVRVLIEAVTWAGLDSMGSRTQKQEEELKALEKMLPLVAERLVGVQKDYAPRLRALLGSSPPPLQAWPEVRAEVIKTEAKREEPKPVVVLDEKREYVPEKEPLKLASSKLSIRSSPSTVSLASTSSSTSGSTAFEDCILETWVLRLNPQKRTAKRSTTIFGIPVHSTHIITPASYYVKPVSSCLSEIKDLRKQCQAGLHEHEHKKKFAKTILGMHDDAQWEIQRLIEAREKASSGERVKRTWCVVGFMERPRRCISMAESGRRGWWRGNGKEAVEWVLVLKGETVDHRCRALPGKHEDPWNPTPVPTQRTMMPMQAPVQMQVQPQVQQQLQQQQQVGAVLRHVENRRAMSADEARRKMEEIVDDLFVVQD